MRHLHHYIIDLSYDYWYVCVALVLVVFLASVGALSRRRGK